MIHSIDALDHAIEAFVVVHRTPFLSSIFTSLTNFGDARIITVLSIAVALVFWRHKLLSEKAGFALALFGSLLSSYVIKIIVQRPRPPIADHLIQINDFSFPSMHAAVSVAVYGYLAYAIFKHLHPTHHRMPVIIFLSIFAALIGISRIYLGVHYLSDVLVGYIFGAIWLALGIWLSRTLSFRS